jgi:hypothetical protein
VVAVGTKWSTANIGAVSFEEEEKEEVTGEKSALAEVAGVMS